MATRRKSDELDDALSLAQDARRHRTGRVVRPTEAPPHLVPGAPEAPSQGPLWGQLYGYTPTGAPAGQPWVFLGPVLAARGQLWALVVAEPLDWANLDTDRRLLVRPQKAPEGRRPRRSTSRRWGTLYGLVPGAGPDPWIPFGPVLVMRDGTLRARILTEPYAWRSGETERRLRLTPTT